MLGRRPARSTWSTAETVFTFAEGRVADVHTDRAATAAHHMIEELMVRANEAVAELPRSAQRAHPLSGARAARPRGGRVAGERLEALDVATPPLPELHDGAAGVAVSGPAGGGDRPPCPPPPGHPRRAHLPGAKDASGWPGMTPKTSAMRGLPAAPTATSPRRSGATPTSSATVPCCTGWRRCGGRPPWRRAGRTGGAYFRARA